MKSRLLIIIGIIISITISVSSLIIIDNIEAQSKFPPLKDDPNAPDELRVILQFCEKPWEDRGLNQQYRNQTHHLDTHNCVWKYNFDKIDWSNNPTKKFEETSFRLVSHACSSWIESKNGREPLTYSNETHSINTDNCEWQERKFVSTTPFGYPRDTTGNYDHCFSYKTDPEYGVEIQNSTHILNLENCEWESISEKTVSGSYELEEALCIGGRDMIKNENCEIIGKYDPTTGIPIVENKRQCDLLDGTWYDDRELCDSKYAPVEYRFQFGPAINNEESEPELMHDEFPLGAIVDCVGGFHFNGTSCIPDDVLTISYGHQWTLKIILIIVLLTGFAIGIVFSIKFWRKRK
jgi:hypothetical protein